MHERPQKVSDIEIAFPGSVKHLIPDYSDIPKEFKTDANPWVKWQMKWFFEGLSNLPTPKPGIDLDEAMRHLRAVQSSFEPRHEHKEAAVAYLASLWFEGEQ